MRLRKKLQSERGASILLALLMLLVCMMVAGSVLAAAASNAGKARSNRVEQQKYLTLSSAIQLVADELEKAAYTGKYTLYTWTVTTDVTDADGNKIGTSSEDFFYIEQQQGDFICGGLGKETETDASAVIPLLKELDAIFNGHFKDIDGYIYGYGAVGGLGLTPDAGTHTLTVTLPNGLTGYPYDSASGPDAYKVSDTVTVEVKLVHNTNHITLTAWLGTTKPADGSDTMAAELVAKAVTGVDADGKFICEDRNPLVTVPPPAGATPGASKPDASAGAAVTDKTVDTMTWQLHWIKKGAA